MGYPIFWHRLHPASRVASRSYDQTRPGSRRSARFLGLRWRRRQLRIGRRDFSFRFIALGFFGVVGLLVGSVGGGVLRLVFGLGLVFSTV